MAVSSERRPYRLDRGHYSRREGDAVSVKDPETGEKIKGLKRQPFVHYQARTPENPRARDEVMLTDQEAAELNKGGIRRVTPLFRQDTMTGGYTRGNPAGEEKPKTLDELIDIGMAVNGTKTLNEFRQLVLKAGYLNHLRVIPSKKIELVGHLRKVRSNQAESLAQGDAAGEA